MTIDVTSIITAIIGVLGTIFAGLITAYLIPWLKSKFTANQLITISGLIESGVKAAKTFFPDNCGEKKFDYVMDSVKSYCTAHHIAFDETAVKNEIQSVWNDLYNKANPAATQVANVAVKDASKVTAPADTAARTPTQATT